MHAHVFKLCACGRFYSRHQWRRLALAGVSHGLEFRHCVCGSTITTPVARKDRPAWLAAVTLACVAAAVLGALLAVGR
jgi:hypothetical protein